jgi:DNA-binding CsgD family transcriptional regulator
MIVSWPLIGRRNELEQLSSAVVGGRNMLVVGPAGVGKTRLVEEVVGTLPAASVLRVAATAAARSVPLGAFGRLLPARPPVANLLGWAVAGIMEHASDGIPLLAVDDMHLLDPASAALVHQLVFDRCVALVGTIRTGETTPDAITALWKNGLTDRMELSALPADDLCELATAVLGGPMDREAADRLWSLSQGVPLMLRELIIGAVAGEILRQRDGAWHWRGQVPTNARLRELIDERLARLDADETNALSLVALAEPLEARALLDLAGPAAAESLEAKGLVRVGRTDRRQHVIAAHPLYAEMIRTSLPELRRSRHYTQLAQVIESWGSRRRDDAIRIALWRLEAGVDQEPEPLLAAFRLAWAVQNGALAERLARAALAAGGGPVAVIALVEVLTYTSRLTESAELIRSVWHEPMEQQVRAHLAVRLAWALNYGLGQPDEASALLDQVEAELDDMTARDTLAMMRCGFLQDLGDNEQAVRICKTLLDGRPIAVEHRADALSTLAVAHAMSGRTALALRVAAECWDERSAWQEGAPYALWALGYAKIRAGQFAGDLDAADAAVAWLESERPLDLLSWADANLVREKAMILRLRGRPAAALRVSEQLRTSDAFIGQFGYGEAAHNAALRGELERARQLRQLAADAPRLMSVHFVIDFADIWIAAQAGLITDAVRQCLALADLAANLGLTGVELLALHDVIRLDGATADIADRLADVASRHDGLLPEVIARHAAAAACHDSQQLLAVADQFSELGVLLYAAEAAAQAAKILNRQDQPRAAAAATTRAHRWAEQCEGARTPALIEMKTAPLSRREHEIAQLAARGDSNKEISQKLVISLRTVENHLHTIFSKLGVTRREDLRDLLS